MTRADWIAAAGAVLSGTGSVFVAVYALKLTRKRLREECEERFTLFREGMQIGERRDRMDP
jgi:hypothetical protein